MEKSTLKVNNIKVTHQKAGIISMFESFAIIIDYFSNTSIMFEQEAREGKAYKTIESRKSKVKEDEQGYGDLFDQ